MHTMCQEKHLVQIACALCLTGYYDLSGDGYNLNTIALKLYVHSTQLSVRHFYSHNTTLWLDSNLDYILSTKYMFC